MIYSKPRSGLIIAPGETQGKSRHTNSTLKGLNEFPHVFNV